MSLSLYREFLRVARSMPTQHRAEYVRKAARSGFEKNRGLHGDELKEAVMVAEVSTLPPRTKIALALFSTCHTCRLRFNWKTRECRANTWGPCRGWVSSTPRLNCFVESGRDAQFIPCTYSFRHACSRCRMAEEIPTISVCLHEAQLERRHGTEATRLRCLLARIRGAHGSML